MATRGLSQAAAARVEKAITSFAAYGFPESHAISFALLSYASAYLKVHHPGVFYLALLNAWPMGFYQPATVVQDAQRHGVQVLPVDVQHSDWPCTVEEEGRPSRVIRLGMRFVRGLRQQAGADLVAARAASPFCSIAELRRRCPGLRAAELETLAAIGALGALPGEPGRREALWQVSGLHTGPL